MVSWSSKKQNCIALSTYGYRFQHIPIYCDSQSAIAISHNPIHHSMTKHIDITYHFIKDHVLNGNIELIFVPSDDEIADLFTKALDNTKFNGFLNKMGMMMPDPQFF